MVESPKAAPSTFETIRRKLDPAYSYMIFEKHAGASDESEFQHVADVLRRLELCVQSVEYLLDDAEEKLLLVVRFAPGRADEILFELMKEGLPKDVTLYAYGSRGAE